MLQSAAQSDRVRTFDGFELPGQADRPRQQGRELAARSACSLFNRTYSINEYAKVAIGQALVIVNDERGKKAADAGEFQGGRELLNYHSSGDILQDGQDYVTLEALADQNATTLTTQWMFRMYGMVDRNASEEEQARQREKTFHGEQSADTHTGTRPIILGVSAS